MTRLLFLAPGDVRKGRVEPISWMQTCSALAERGVDVRLVTLNVRWPDSIATEHLWSHYGLPPRFSVQVLPTPLGAHPSTWWFRVCAGSAAAALATAELGRQALKPRDLVVYSRSPALIAPFVALSRALPRARRPRLVLETHTLPPRRLAGLVRNVDLLVVNSLTLRDDAVREFGLDPARVLHAPLGPFNPVRVHPMREAREQLGLPHDAVLACYSGKMIEAQNEFLLQTALRLRDGGRNVRLLLVGGNPGILDWTRRRIRELGLENTVILAGFVEPPRVELYQAAADVLVLHMDDSLTHFTYATPAKAYEYMAARRPIVATELPLSEELFGASGERALRIVERTPDALADGILAALALPDGGSAMTARAADYVRGRTWKRRAESLLEALAA